MPDTDIRLDAKLLERIERKKQLLDTRRPLSGAALKRLQEELRVAHTYNSNAIEGNTLTRQETKLVIEDGITIGGKPLREHLEATGNAEAFDRIFRFAKEDTPLDHVTVLEIHGLVTRGIQMDSGQYRTINVRISGAAKMPPDFSKVPGLMGALLRATRDSQHPVILSASLHHGIARIHPFSDGNGRTARLLANLLLMRKGYPPVVLRKEDRKKYYACLARADAGDMFPFANYIARSLDESLTLFLASFGGRDSLIPLSQLAKASPYSAEYLGLRARQGMLSAVKLGKAWHSTRRALDEYVKEHGR
ncbi:MAG: Fic family protein [Thermoplasmata archaeon]